MTVHLIDALLETGMLQFGQFHENGMVKPYRFLFDLLPAYPDLLKDFVDVAASNIPAGVERLIAVPEAIPLGVALSLKTEISLIYSRGRGEDPAFDLVGSYDAGRRAIAVCNVLLSDEQIKPLLHSIRRVGLDVVGVLALVGGAEVNLETKTQMLLTLQKIGHYLLDSKKVPEGMVRSLI